MMCFIGFLLEREMENLVKNDRDKGSPAQIQEALRSMELSHLSVEGESFYLRSKHQSLASRLFAKLRIKLPKNLSTEAEIEDYMKEI